MALHAVRQERSTESAASPSRDRLRLAARAWMLVAVASWAGLAATVLLAAAESRRADQLAKVAGMTPLSGRGMEIVINDPRRAPAAVDVTTGSATHAAPPAAQAASPAPTQVVTDGDLILLNMLLWYGGARAVAINNQRITAQTTITSSGPVILINGTRLVPPFRVTALGDPETLKGVLGEAGLIDQMRGAGIAVSMSAQSALRVPGWQPGAETAH